MADIPPAYSESNEPPDRATWNHVDGHRFSYQLLRAPDAWLCLLDFATYLWTRHLVEIKDGNNPVSSIRSPHKLLNPVLYNAEVVLLHLIDSSDPLQKDAEGRGWSERYDIEWDASIQMEHGPDTWRITRFIRDFTPQRANSNSSVELKCSWAFFHVLISAFEKHAKRIEEFVLPKVRGSSKGPVASRTAPSQAYLDRLDKLAVKRKERAKRRAERKAKAKRKAEAKAKREAKRKEKKAPKPKTPKTPKSKRPDPDANGPDEDDKKTPKPRKPRTPKPKAEPKPKAPKPPKAPSVRKPRAKKSA
jgi:hypothetical protein